MTRKNVSAPERLELLLPWLNGDEDDPSEALRLFLGQSVGERGAETFSHDGRASDLTRRQVGELRGELLRLLETTDRGAAGDPWRSLASLRFTVMRQRDRPDEMPRGAQARRAIEGPGAFSLQVHGRLRDLVLYVFMRTLTEPGMVNLTRCPAPAPAPGDRSETCGRYLVTGGRRGRPQVYCSRACRLRAWREKEAEERRIDWR